MQSQSMGGLFVVLALMNIVMITMSAASPVLPDSSEKDSEMVSPVSVLHRNERGLGCKLTDGRIITDGDNFTRLETGPCVFYWCNNGSVLPFEYGCYRNQQCFPLHNIYKLGCIERTCQLYEGHFEYTITKEGCLGRDLRTCIAVGSTYKEGCFEYRCDKRQESGLSVSFHLEQTDFGCELNGQCVPENYTQVQGCRTIQCQKRFMNVGFYTISDGCEINGKCVAVGHTLVDNCRTFNCTVRELNGLNILNIDPIKIQCRDTDGVCHDSGTFFPIEVNHQRANCTCKVIDYNIEYSCPGVGV